MQVHSKYGLAEELTDTYHYLIGVKLGERLSVSKQILSLGKKKGRSKEAHQIRRSIWEADTKMDL
jgi:hypothetical protein